MSTPTKAQALEQCRAEFMAWVADCGCDTDGAWSAWQAAWNRRTDAAPAAADGVEAVAWELLTSNGWFRLDDQAQAARFRDQGRTVRALGVIAALSNEADGGKA